MNRAPQLLVIDDDRSICQALSLHLKYRGFAAATVGNAAAGLDRIRAGGIDLVLCDIGLPDASGHEVVQRSRAVAAEANFSPPEFVMMTGNATLDHAVESLREGACQFVTKPLSMPYLEVVIDQALAQRRLREQVALLEARQHELVLRALSDVTGRLGLVGALESVLHAVEVLFEPAHAAVWLVAEADQLVRAVASEGYLEPEEAAHHEAAIGCLSAGTRICVAPAAGGIVAAPIPVGPAVGGVITLSAGPTETQLELLETIARFAGDAVEKERQLSNLEQSSMQISSLFEVGLAMSSEVSLQKLFDVVVESAARICGADRCSLMVLDPGGEILRIRAARGIPPEIVAKAESVVGQGIAGSVAASGEPLFIADIEHSDRFGRKNAERYNNTSLVCVPIRLHDRVVGVINVNNKQNGASFTENDLNLLTLLASQAAVAIDNAQRYQDLSEQAVTDGLTGVYVRRYFDECIERAFVAAGTTGRKFALLMVDIDHFKKVNDTYGHPSGDVALRQVARILQEAVRDDDLVTRYGGEEFAVILARSDVEIAARVAERIRATIEQTPIRTDEAELRITASVGVAVVEGDHGTPGEVVKAADDALYQAKESGRNRVVVSGAPS